MPPLYDGQPPAGRVRIKGTDPRVRATTDRIGRGTRVDPESMRRAYLEHRDMNLDDNLWELAPRRRIEMDNAIEARGGRASDADINDDFARRLGMADPEPVSASRQRYLDSLPKPFDPNQRYYHTSEAPAGRSVQEHARSLRERGILGSERTSFGEGKQVFAHPNAPRELGPRQVYVEFTPGTRPSGGGTSFMGRGGASTARSFSGDVAPSKVSGVYGHLPEGGIGRIAGHTGLLGLLNSFSTMLGGPGLNLPTDMVLNDLIAQNYGPGGIMDPYRDVRDMPGFNSETGTMLA